MFTSLEIKGYRLLDDFEADLGPLTVVIGANAAGKSTLLDALQLISHCVEFPLGTALGWHMGLQSILSAHQNSKSVSWKLNFKRPDENYFWGKIALEPHLSYTYEVVLSTDPQGQVFAQYETLRNQAPHVGFPKPFMYMESTPFRSSVFDRTKRELVPFDEAVLTSQPLSGATNGVMGETGTPVALKEQALRLSQMRFLNEFPVPSTARLMIASMAFYPGFEVGRYSPLRINPSEIRPETTLRANGENLGTVLHEMLTRYDFKSHADDLRDFMRAAYPFFEDLTAETTYGAPPKVLVRVRERQLSRSMELWDLSDGMLRFLCLCATLLNPLPAPLVALDEPESGLHPRLLPILGDLIKVASDRTQVLVTTHSPDLLNRFQLPEIAVLSRESDRARWFRPSTRGSLATMLESVTSESLGDLHRSGELEVLE